MRRVKRPGHGQRHGPHRPGGLGHFGHARAGGFRARNGDIPRTKQIGHLQKFPLGGLRGKALRPPADRVPRMLTMPLGTRSAASCIAAPRVLHDSQAVFEIHHAGEHQGRVFAQAQAGRRLATLHRRGIVGFQRFQGRQAGDEQRRLAMDGRIEQFGRPLEADLGQIVAQQRAGPIEQVARRPAATRPIAAPCRRSEPLGPERGKRFCSKVDSPLRPAESRQASLEPEIASARPRSMGAIGRPTMRRIAFAIRRGPMPPTLGPAALFFDFDDRAAHVGAAFGANHVRGHGGAALPAIGQLPGLFGVVRPPAAGFRIRLSALWNGHDRSPNPANPERANPPGKCKPHNVRPRLGVSRCRRTLCRQPLEMSPVLRH